MKKSFLVLTGLFLIVLSALPNSRHRKMIVDNPHTRVDSIIEYRWNSFSGEWSLDSTWANPDLYMYIYKDKLLSIILITEKHSGDTLRRELFFYTSNELIETHIYQDYKSGKWQNIRKDSLAYNTEGLTTLFLLQQWKNDHWTRIYRFTDYQYDENDLPTYYLEQHWSDNLWNDYATEFRFYDDEGFLTMRLNQFVDGTNRFRFLYNFDPTELVSEWIHQPWKDGEWSMGVKQITWLNNCNQAVSQVRMNWNPEQNTWINYSRKEFYRSLAISPDWKYVRIPLCHRGKSILLPVRAVSAHLKHGDCVGSCVYSRLEHTRKYDCKPNDAENKKSGTVFRSDNQTDNQLSYYPNPFSEQLTVKLPLGQTYKKLEILDLSGRIMKTYLINEQNTLTIERGNLKAGIYFLKLSGFDVLVKKIIIN